ncbi:nitrilase-related carbon-nitrogen hydrolase [Brachybacterium aquaticum]|uniref:Putative amidohydrolase/molybdopterin-guanine dinucleotide biosynthesis protein A n=1 Tax=Brachybacterium aquaticum TaxID=1432564 RepID=A0A841A5Z0_9MICO|nr:nitrilase-related carbon-nitrogen hydrolase [Brachybacterium aquaticum]MBB5830569.1 putative amidohydrolase/molybdopterin-guanine dinucleotide biosynthesis protein A [Brachybacterium aquaticum]
MSRQPHETTATVAAVILAGGASSRLGGTDKTRLPIAGATVLERVLRAAPVGRRIVVGPTGEDGADLAARHGARFVLEDPPRSGPLAALARGVAEISEAADEATVLVLGGDMPMLRPETLHALAARSAETGRVVALEAVDGHLQFLGAAWPLGRLRTALAAVEREDGGWADLSLRRLYAELGEEELTALPTTGAEGADVDTPDALDQVRRAAGPRVALAQLEIPTDYEAMVAAVRGVVAEAAEEGAHLVVLPEATLTPFGTDLRAAAEAHHEDFAGLLQELADAHDLVIVAGSFRPADDGRVHNTVLVRGPGGTPSTEYRKIHLFDAFDADESATVAPGEELVTFEVHGTRFGIATCYDMRFPEQFTALARRGAQAIVLPTAWAEGPGKREQLQLLLRARALDSTSVILAADQAPPAGYAGRAPRGVGHSAAVGPLGRIRRELGVEPGLLMVDLDLAEVESARAALPVLRHAVELPAQ